MLLLSDEMNVFSVVNYLLAAGSLLLVTRCIYRVTFHPLARFPGPPLAGLSSLYAMSWDFPRRSSYSNNFARWHDTYGPIIRIEPNHLHIRDMDAYNAVFKVGTKFNRDSAFYSNPFIKGGFFNKFVVREGKVHRDLYVPFFSKANVVKMEHLIREHLAHFLTKLQEASQRGKSLDLSLGYRCLTADTLMDYTYDRPFGALDAEDFEFPMIIHIEEFFNNRAFEWYFPTVMGGLASLFMRLPRSWMLWHKPISSSLAILDGCAERIIELRGEPKDRLAQSIFVTAMHPNPEKGHPILSNADMAADALTIFVAGTDTTAHALVTGTWNLIQNPVIAARLQAALREAIADPTTMDLDWAALERIDYLRAVVKESIRLSYGVPGKLPRQVPLGGTTLCEQYIPAGTMLSMSCQTYHHSPKYFDDPLTFLPERWLDKDSAANAERNFIAFSRGSRNCIGMNLAYAELFYAFAYLFRRFKVEKAPEMKDEDMDWHDAFVVATFGHLKVKVTALED